MPEQETVRDAVARVLIESSMLFQALRDAANPDEPADDEYFKQQAKAQADALAATGLLASIPPVSDPAVEMECPSCGAMVQSRLQDQAVLAELRKQGWAPPPTISREQLVEHLTRIRVEGLTPVNGEVCINAESMADAIAIVLTEAGIEVRDV